MMAGKPKLFTADTRDNVASLLTSLPEKQNTEKKLAAKDIITSLKAEIRSAQSKGYTIEEIVQYFQQGGVDIGLTTLKSTIRELTKKRPARVAQKVKHQDENNVAPDARRTVNTEERQALRNDMETTLTPAATKRGLR